MHHYRTEDAVAAAYAMVFLVESGYAQQTDVSRAFGRSERTVRYAHGGMAALSGEEGWRRGRRRINFGKVILFVPDAPEYSHVPA